MIWGSLIIWDYICAVSMKKERSTLTTIAKFAVTRGDANGHIL